MTNSERAILDKLIAENSFNTNSLDSFPYPIMLISSDRFVVEANKMAKDLGIENGRRCWDTFGQCASIPEEDKIFFQSKGVPPEGGTKCTFCRADEAIAANTEQNYKVTIGVTTWDTFWIPVENNSYLHFGIQVED